MGIDISDNREVIFNNTHDKLVDTSVAKNPRCIFINQIPVSYIFRRLESKKHRSDGNPLIYALKGLHKYTIKKSEIRKILPNFYEILDKVLQDCEHELILTLPSSYNIGRVLASRVQRAMPNVEIEHSFFSKKTVREFLDEFDVSTLPEQLRADGDSLKRDLTKYQSPNSLFKMKTVNKKLREYIEPLKLTSNKIPDANSILLVDDIISTGTTLTNAVNLLRQLNQEVSIEGLCLLGKICNR